MKKFYMIPAAEMVAAKTKTEKMALIEKYQSPLSDAEIAERVEAENQALAAQAEAEKMAYRDLRRAEYPDIGDQLDAIMKWLATEGEFTVPAELKSLAMKCMSVKAKYPKPAEE